MTPEQILTWLASAGGAIAAFSWLAERFKGWHSLTAELKRIYSTVGSALIALSAYATLVYAPPELLAAIHEPFVLIVGIFASVFLKERWHSATKA